MRAFAFVSGLSKRTTFCHEARIRKEERSRKGFLIYQALDERIEPLKQEFSLREDVFATHLSQVTY
jgi:hypothetical protein